MLKKEAFARIKINKLLESAGWNFEKNIQLEPGVEIQDLENLGEDFEHSKKGFLDYLLLDDKGYPLLVLEAKREEKSPLDGKEQARDYALANHVRFIILSNGNLHYFWDLEHGLEKIITEFPSQQSLTALKAYEPNFTALADAEISDDYIAKTQMPDYSKDPDWISDGELRKQFVEKNNLKFLRPYQLDAIKAIQTAASEEKERYLLEMATGTGKTLTTIAISKLFLETGNATRILFLVDRIELEEQALNGFKDIKNDYTARIYKKSRDNWRSAEIVISTVQTLLIGDRYKKEFDPTDFDLVISDEAHRSIGGNARKVFEYFIGYKLGLTATPKDYLKNIDKKRDNDIETENKQNQNQKNTERRQLLDTYKTFGCPSGEPTFRYDLKTGARDGYLIQPTVLDARTNITTELLSEEGYAVERKNKEDEVETQVYFSRHFERTFFNDETNIAFATTFIENALRDPISKEIGKSLIFCVSQNHASKMTHILNEIAARKWPGKYQSDFAIQVSSNVEDAQKMTTQFSHNNLNGKTRFLDEYDSSRARVCVTVSMMTTGYDCPDLLNVAFLRPVFSPADFIQMKGRGTRKTNFSYENESGEIKIIPKTSFKLFDFFAVCEYFEEKFDYDEVLQLPQNVGNLNSSDLSRAKTIDENIDLKKEDQLKSIKEEKIGNEGMRVDREVWGEQAKKVLAEDDEIKEQYESGDIYGAEETAVSKYFDKPELFITRGKFKKAYKLDRRPRVREILEYVFGDRDKFQTKDDIISEEFTDFVQNEVIAPENYAAARDIFSAYASDENIRQIIDSGEYGKLEFAGIDMHEFLSLPNSLRHRIPEYARDYVLEKVAE